MYNKFEEIKSLAEFAAKGGVFFYGEKKFPIDEFSRYWLSDEPWNDISNIGEEEINAHVIDYDFISDYGTTEVFLAIRTKWTEKELEELIPD